MGMDRRELADFLRTRRARVSPIEVGLPGNSRRRVPGLRREEVAQLAGMSVDYYTRLEQGRGPHPSRQILNALGRALMLTTDERAHLFHLTGQAPALSQGPRRDVPEGVLHLLEGLDGTPAYVLDAKYDMLAWNDTCAALFGWPYESGPKQGNVIRWIFAAPNLREHLCDEEKSRFAWGSVADLRAAAARYPEDRGIRELVAEMLALSPEFAQMWATHDVEVRRDQRKVISHPELGEIAIECQVLHIPDRDQRLIIYTAAPGSPAQLKLCQLRALSKNGLRNLPAGS
ncbi:transcriptional regulator [Rhizocola hellebori]|uniref:Transcriptional regulator n=2 Tax=Rhizocola hellebori TaxID=1392758 RepID=A0A8J3Q4K1_9ACTN|nr:transcriptional regulator [Rhizocola hellebori]